MNIFGNNWVGWAGYRSSDTFGPPRADRSRRSPARRAAAGICSAVAATVGCLALSVSPAEATLPGPVVVKGSGFDSCALPPASYMAKWWTDTPYWAVGVYLGGDNDQGCSSGLSHAWLATVMTQGWGVWLIWDGPQDPCDLVSAPTFSTNASTATVQGEAQARAAVSRAASLNFGDEYIYYDMEA